MQLILTPNEGGQRQRQCGSQSCERRPIACKVGGWLLCIQDIDGFFLPRHFEKQLTLVRRNLQMLRQQLGNLTRRPAFVRFDLENQGERASNAVSELLLR